MKNLIKSILIILSAVLMTACLSEVEIDGPRPLEGEGIPVQVEMGLQVHGNSVVTKASQSHEQENRVENLYVFIFNGSGQVHDRFFIKAGETKADGTQLTVSNATTSGKTTGTLKFKTLSVNNASIVALANISETESTDNPTAYSVVLSELDEITSRSQLESSLMRLDVDSETGRSKLGRGARFLMTGWAQENEHNSKTFNILAYAGGENKLDCTIYLDRADAKIQFIVKAGTPKEGISNFSFEPTTWQIVNVPQQCYIVPNAEGDYNATDATYFSSLETTFENTDNTGSTFVVYMPENRKTPLKIIPDEIDGVSDDALETARYALREKQDKTVLDQKDPNKPQQTHQNGAFTYANTNSTYVILKGRVRYLETESGREVSGTVVSTVHLGYAQGETKDVNNYDTNRNTYYTYTVTVSGVDDILVEVEADSPDTEPRPGYIGDISRTSAKLYELDAHYSRVQVVIDNESISPDMTWAVKTPYSSGTHEAGTSPTDEADASKFSNIRDYKWIKFAINCDYGVADDQLVRFPGESNYNDPHFHDAPYISSGEENYSTFNNNNQSSSIYESYKDARLLDVDQLINRLNELKNSNSAYFHNGKIYITAFIEEYLYFRNPNNDYKYFDEVNYRSNWKTCVGADDRELHIILGAKYSSDGESSLVNSIITFRQRSIQTVFNKSLSDAELNTAWGIETLLETGRLYAINSNKSNPKNEFKDGRNNQWYYLKDNMSWSSLLSDDAASKTGLNNNYEFVTYACADKNRDLNGNGTIEKNEIRWYLAAVNQYNEFYIGERSLDRKYWLYPGVDNLDRDDNKVQWHYAPSTMLNANEPEIFWSEEGCCLGSYNSKSESSDYQPHGGTWGNGNKFAFRCVRNLGIGLTNTEEEPKDLIVKTTDDDSGNHTFDLKRVNPTGLREARYDTELGNHVHTDADNTVYVKFETNASMTGYDAKNGVTSVMDHYIDGTYLPCPDGYRVPNQREMMVMIGQISNEFTDINSGDIGGYATRSEFALRNQHGYNDYRKGFWFNGKNQFFSLLNPGENNLKHKTRCVKDYDLSKDLPSLNVSLSEKTLLTGKEHDVVVTFNISKVTEETVVTVDLENASITAGSDDRISSVSTKAANATYYFKPTAAGSQSFTIRADRTGVVKVTLSASGYRRSSASASRISYLFYDVALSPSSLSATESGEVVTLTYRPQAAGEPIVIRLNGFETASGERGEINIASCASTTQTVTLRTTSTEGDATVELFGDSFQTTKVTAVHRVNVTFDSKTITSASGKGLSEDSSIDTYIYTAGNRYKTPSGTVKMRTGGIYSGSVTIKDLEKTDVIYFRYYNKRKGKYYYASITVKELQEGKKSLSFGSDKL